MPLKDKLKKINRFLKKVFFKVPEARELVTEIDPESLKTKEELMHLQKALAYEKGKRVKAERIVESLTKKEEDDNRREVAEFLSKQRNELLQRETGITASIFRLLTGGKKKKKIIHVVSYNREKDFGILRDIGISPKGMLSVYVKGVKSPVISGVNPQQVFRNCSGVKNDADKGMLSINLDSEGNFVENIEQIEVPEVVIDFNKKLNIMEHDTKPFIERVIEKDEEINEYIQDIKLKERMLSKLNKEVNIKKKDNEVLNEENNIYKSDLSDTLNRMTEMQKNYNKLTRSLSILEEENLFYEKIKERTQITVDELHKKFADKEKRELIENAIKELRLSIDWYHSKIQELPIGGEIIGEGRREKEEEKEEEEKSLPPPVKG